MELMVCVNCEETIKGRSDKKFCSAQCRSEYNNVKNREINKIYSVTNTILKKNHQILSKFNPSGKQVVKKNRLQEAGYRFDHCTSYFITKEGRQYYFSYDQGYFEDIDKGLCILVKKR